MFLLLFQPSVVFSGWSVFLSVFLPTCLFLLQAPWVLCDVGHYEQYEESQRAGESHCNFWWWFLLCDFEPVNSLLCIFLSLPHVFIHFVCLERQLHSIKLVCVFTAGPAWSWWCFQKQIYCIYRKKNYFVGHLLFQELCRDCSVLPMLQNNPCSYSG